MCVFGNTPTPEAPKMPPEYAQQRTPDAGATNGASRRTQDRIRAGTNTILTSGSGVTAAAPTEKKTLLGQ